MATISHDQLANRLDIAELVNGYAVHIDLFEVDKWVNLFSKDAIFDESEFETGLHVGHDAIRAYGQLLANTVQHAVHLMANLVIRDLTPRTASGVVFAQVEAMMNDGVRQRWQVRYEDEYVKVDDEWKIQKRILRKTFPVEDVSIKT